MEAPADPKVAYENARKELIAALQKKRAVDKSLVSFDATPQSFWQATHGVLSALVAAVLGSARAESICVRVKLSV